MHVLDQAWETIRSEFDSACSQAARAARCQVTNELNQILRRLRHYETEGEWVSAVLDGASRFVEHVALFGLNNAVLTLRGHRKLGLKENLSFSAASAAAFAAVIETQDSVIALRTPGEVTDYLSSSEPGERAHVIPIMNAGRVAGILFTADRDYVDVNGLELISGLASAVLERKSNSALHTQIATRKPSQQRENSTPEAPSKIEASATLVPSNGTTVTPRLGLSSGKSGLPSWVDLSEEQRSLHIRAQRFSRVTVAEMQISRPEACRAGREQGNLYVFLKKEIDTAREAYRNQFMTISSMVDYLHLELVSTAAEGDELKLGADYPGQLV